MLNFKDKLKSINRDSKVYDLVKLIDKELKGLQMRYPLVQRDTKYVGGVVRNINQLIEIKKLGIKVGKFEEGGTCGIHIQSRKDTSYSRYGGLIYYFKRKRSGDNRFTFFYEKLKEKEFPPNLTTIIINDFVNDSKEKQKMKKKKKELEKSAEDFINSLGMSAYSIDAFSIKFLRKVQNGDVDLDELERQIKIYRGYY